MGMFDTLICEMTLPYPAANGLDYQTKSLDCALDTYVLRADQTLWHEDYDIEDKSDPAATGLARLIGAMAKVNKRLVPMTLTGEVRFHGTTADGVRFDWSAYFVGGRRRELHLLEEER